MVSEQCTAHNNGTHLQRTQSNEETHIQHFKTVINIWGWGRQEGEQGLTQLSTPGII